MLTELQQLLGEEVELELFRETCNPSEQDMGLFNTLEAVLKEVDPEGIPMPMLLPAFTDACFFHVWVFKRMVLFQRSYRSGSIFLKQSMLRMNGYQWRQ